LNVVGGSILLRINARWAAAVLGVLFLCSVALLHISANLIAQVSL